MTDCYSNLAPSRLLWTIEPKAFGVCSPDRGLARSQISGCCNAQTFHYAPQPNCQVNADATKGHAFGILMALGCALRPAGSGAGYLGS
jgi:hypothetical protein